MGPRISLNELRFRPSSQSDNTEAATKPSFNESTDSQRTTDFTLALDRKWADLRNLVLQEVARGEIGTEPAPRRLVVDRVQGGSRSSSAGDLQLRLSGPRLEVPSSTTFAAPMALPPATKAAPPSDFVTTSAAPVGLQPAPKAAPPSDFVTTSWSATSPLVPSPHAAQMSAVLAARKKERRRSSPRPESAEMEEPQVRFSEQSLASRDLTLMMEDVGAVTRPSGVSERSAGLSNKLYRNSMYEERASHCSLEPARMWAVDGADKSDRSGYTRFFLSEVTKLQELPENDDSGPVSRCMLRYLMTRPTSMYSVVWDVLFMVLIGYELVAIPLQLFDLEENRFQVAMTWIARIFWTLSIPKSFCTGYLRSQGTLEMNPGKVALNYLKTWLLFDLLIVTSDWLENLAEVSNILSTSRLVRLVRTMRVIKVGGVMRVGRGTRVLARFTAWSQALNMETVNFAFGTFQIFIAIFAVAHFIACLWYGLGMLGYERGLLNWVQDNHILGTSLSRRYSISLHWAVSQFIGSQTVQPLNDAEYIFATCTLVFAFVTSAGFVSSLTNLMTRLSILGGYRAIQFAILHRFLRQRSISTDLTFRVQSAAEYMVAERRNYIPETEVELLQQLTRPLLMEVHYEVFAPVLRWHPLFLEYDNLDRVAFQHICHKAVSQSFLALADLLFAEDERMVDGKMFFIMQGSLVYTSQQLDKACVVSEGAWVCEMGIWAEGWKHLGELRAAKPCIVLSLDASAFQIAAGYFSQSADMPRKYADEITKHVNSLVLKSPYRRVVDDIDIQDFDAELVAQGLFRRFKRLQTRDVTRLSEVGAPEAFRVQAQKMRKMWRFGSISRPSVSSQHLHNSVGSGTSACESTTSRQRSSSHASASLALPSKDVPSSPAVPSEISPSSSSRFVL